MALSVPEPQPDDSEDLSTALETAAIFSAQGDVRETVRWVRRAAELAGDAGDDMRALTLARAVAELGESVAPSAPPPAAASAAAAPAPAAAAPAPAAAAEAPAAASAPAVAAPVVAAAPDAELPPPPPLPPREIMATGDRITNPGIAPPSTPAAARQAEASPERPVASRPASIPPPTGDEDAGWNDADSEPETPRPTNGAGEAHAAPAAFPVAPAVPEPATTPAAAPVALPSQHQAVRARIEPTTETGVFRLTLLAAGESAGDNAHEALVVLLDPTARFES